MSPAPSADRALLVAELGPYRLAFAADAVEVLGPAAAADGFAPHLDLAASWGLPPDPRGRGLRTVRLRTAAGEVRVELGERMQLQAVAATRVRPLPAFVAPALRGLGVEALVALDDGIAFLMDGELLAAAAAGPGRRA